MIDCLHLEIVVRWIIGGNKKGLLHLLEDSLESSLSVVALSTC